MKKSEKLLEILGEVDEKHLSGDEDKEEPKKKNNILKWIGGAAGLSAAAAICIFAVNGLKAPDPIETTPADTSSAVTSAPVSSSVSETSAAPISAGDAEISYERSRKTTVVSEITANSVSGANVLADTAFTVKTNVDLPAEELIGKITITPPAELDITKTDDCLYTLLTDISFDKGSVVKLAVEAEEGGTGNCWAFQIIDDFRVKDVYPADGRDHVSTDTGIEITFSESVDMSDIEKHFSIKPEVSGKFSTHGNTVYFVPDKDLTDNTFYTVTVSKGLKAASGSELSESAEFSFSTDRVSMYFINGGTSETFISGDPVVVEISGWDYVAAEVDTKLYRYSSADDYMRDLSDYAGGERSDIDFDKLTEVFASNEKPMYGNTRNSFVLLPDDLEEGHYVARLKFSGNDILHFIEMEPMSVYTMSLGDNTLFYVNDTDTGEAAFGADIKLHTKNGVYTAKADADGIARIYTGDNSYRSDIVEISYNGHRYIDSAMNYSVYKPTYSDLFYIYIYTDREAYRLTDTINVWGMVRPRRRDAKVPEKMLLRFGEGESGGSVQEIKLSADGTFTAEISYADRNTESWGAYIGLLDADNENAEMWSRYVRILDYVKPNYTFDINVPEYLIMPHINAFDAEIDAEYFDGTPAEGLTFTTARGKTRAVSGEIETDKDGKAYASMKSEDDGYFTLKKNVWATFDLTGIEGVSQYSTVFIPAVFRDVMLDYEYDEESGYITVKTNKLNLDRFGEFVKADMTEDAEEIMRGEPFDTKVKIRVQKSWTEKVEIGSFYDFLEKKTVKQYRYDYHSEDLGTYEMRTDNGEAVFTQLSLPSDRSCYYTVEFKWYDSLDQETYFTEYYLNWNRFTYSNGTQLRVFTLDREKTTFEEDEEIGFSLYEVYDTGNPEPEGKVLFISYQNDMIDAVVYDSTKFSYKADDRCTPNFSFCGAYFDGRHVFSIRSDSQMFVPKKRGITFDISSDKEKYDAGGEVTLTVYAKDMSGRPVAGAPLALSVVDEAAFAVEPQHVDILSSIYAYVHYPEAQQTCSYVQHVLTGLPGSEMGGGGGESDIRKDFRDNPYFGELKTDANGKAVFKFKLADSITTWRATVQAVSEIDGRLCAGNDKFPIIATRPIFITPIMLSEFVAGDDIAITAKCAGLPEGKTISVNISGENVDETIDILPTRTANFGKLPAGSYTVTFRADDGTNKDAVELPLNVIDTRLEVPIFKEMGIGELSGISPTKWPVNVTFYDKEYLFCKEILQELSFYDGSRLDMRAAAEFAEKELGYLSDGPEATVSDATKDGLAKLMKNSNPQIRITSLLCAAFPEYVNKEAVTYDVYDLLRGCDYTELSQCYMALAAIGKPVLGDIKNILSEYDEKLSVYSKLNLISGLALGGDFDAAYENYIKLTGGMKFYSDEDGKPYAIFEGPSYTTAALITASVLDLPEAEALARGILKVGDKFDGMALELVVYIRNYVPKTSGASFSYNAGGTRKTVELTKYGRYTISFDKEQFLNADIRTENGEVLVYACYTGKLSEKNDEPTLSVTKTYSPGTGSIKPGDVIEVTIDTQPYSVIYDTIPSCARVFGIDENGWSSRGSQRIMLYSGHNGIVRYKMRINTSGEFISEGAYVYRSGQKGNTWGTSSPTAITVNEKDEIM